MEVVTSIAGPNLALFLVVIGVLAVYVEFLRPGLILPGVLGAALAITGMHSLAASPVRWAAAGAVFAGFALLIAESLWPARYVLTGTGIVTMMAAALFLIDAPDRAARIDPLTAACMIIPFAVISQFLFTFAARAWRNKRRLPIS